MLHVAIGLGLVLGLGVGLLAAVTESDLLMAIAAGSAPFGTAFMSAIRMVIIPLVIAVVFSGVAKLGDPRKLGRLGGITLGFFWLTVIPAILLGMAMSWLGLQFSPELAAPLTTDQQAPELPGLIDFLLGLIPDNPFAAASNGQLLPLIVFTTLFAAAAGTLQHKLREILLTFADAVSDALIRLVRWILWTAPVGVFGLAAPVTAQLGWSLIQSLAVFVISVVVGLGIYLGLMYLIPLRVICGIGPRIFFGGTLSAAYIAFSTTSTVTALPITLEEAKRNLGVSEPVADLVIPLGASMYRAGSALFQGAAIVFLADLYNVPFPVTAVGGALLATFLVSLTVAPVPSSGVMTLAPALDAVGIPLSGLAILLGIDRIPDMFRSTTNLLGQITTAALVDRWIATQEGTTVGNVNSGVVKEGTKDQSAVYD